MESLDLIAPDRGIFALGQCVPVESVLAVEGHVGGRGEPVSSGRPLLLRLGDGAVDDGHGHDGRPADDGSFGDAYPVWEGQVGVVLVGADPDEDILRDGEAETADGEEVGDEE